MQSLRFTGKTFWQQCNIIILIKLHVFIYSASTLRCLTSHSTGAEPQFTAERWVWWMFTSSLLQWGYEQIKNMLTRFHQETRLPHAWSWYWKIQMQDGSLLRLPHEQVVQLKPYHLFSGLVSLLQVWQSFQVIWTRLQKNRNVHVMKMYWYKASQPEDAGKVNTAQLWHADCIKLFFS